MPQEMTLQQKVSAILEWPDEHLTEPISPDDFELSEFENSLLNWGYCYGLAVAAACAEQPFEGWESVAARAWDAAQAEYAEYTGKAPQEALVIVGVTA